MIPDLAAALSHLPHGPEFRFLDKLENLEPGRRASAVFTVPDHADWLRGHFPANPLVPGVLLVEALAQLAGVVAQSDPALPPLLDLRLTAIRHAKILGTAGPRKRLRVTASIRGRLGNLVQAEGSVHCENELLLLAEVTLAGTARPDAHAPAGHGVTLPPSPIAGMPQSGAN